MRKISYTLGFPKKATIAFSILIYSYVCLAHASAKEITIGMGTFEPYYIAEKNTGIFTDLIKAVFEKMPEHEPKFIFGLSQRILWLNLKSKKIDAVSNLFDSVDLDVCRSEQVFRFNDVAISRVEKKYKIDQISDLSDFRIVTFQGARDFFGSEFSNLKFSNYIEVASPEKQANLLMLNRADVSVGDMYIFMHNLDKSAREVAPLITPSDFSIHRIFPATYSRMGFLDSDICQQFDRALTVIQKNGRYEEIYRFYLKKYGGIEN